MRSTLAVMTVAMLLILPAQVMAQGDQLTGIVDGEVVDADGAGLPGATATIEGENLIEASRSATSDVAGEFRFRNLRPGSYIVTVALTGFQTMAYNVRVSVGTTASVIAELELAGVSETVTVVSETPLIDIESSSLTTSYGADMLENVPVVRDFTDMTNFAPGFADKGAYGAGGNHAEGTSAHRVGSATNGYRLNGVDITENEWGTTWVNPNVDTIAEIQIVGVGASAEHSEFTGAMINLVTKGGTNEFHGSGSFYFENGSLRSDNSGGIIDLERGKYSYDREWSVTVGGPIVRNKLLFFGSIGRNETLDSVVADQIWLDGGIAVDDAQQGNDRWTMHGRVDFLLNDTNTFGFMINNDPGRETNRDLRTGSPLDVAMDTDYGSITLLLSWQSQLGDNTFTDLRFASNAADFLRLPLVCCELPDYWFNNSRRITRGFLEDEDNARKEISGTVTQYVDDFLGVAHDAKIGLQYKDSWSSWIAGYTGLGGLFTYNYYGYSYTYGSIYDIGLEGQTVSSAAFIQDDVTVTDNVTLNLGLRFERTNWHERLDGKPTGAPWVHQLNYLAPRFGGTWDLGGDGRAVAHGSWGRYFEKSVISHVSTASGTAYQDPYQPYASYYFDIPDGLLADPNNPTDAELLVLQELVFQPENLVSIDAATIPLAPGVQGMHTDIFNIGFEYEFVDDWVVGVDYIHKDDSNFIRAIDTITHNYTAFDYTSPDATLADGTVVPGTSQTLYSKDDGLREPILGNLDYYKRTHDIVTLTLDRRRTGSGLNISTSLTYQNNRGTLENGDGESLWGWGPDAANHPNFNGNPFAMDGPLRFSRKWSWKVLGNYRLPGDILAGMYWNLSSGRPWNLQVDHNSRAGGLTALRNMPYGSTHIEKIGSRTWDSLNQLDLRLSKSFNMGAQGRLELMVDGFNLLNNFSPTGVSERINRTFRVAGGSSVGSPRASTSLLPGRQFRLGTRISF